MSLYCAILFNMFYGYDLVVICICHIWYLFNHPRLLILKMNNISSIIHIKRTRKFFVGQFTIIYIYLLVKKRALYMSDLVTNRCYVTKWCVSLTQIYNFSWSSRNSSPPLEIFSYCNRRASIAPICAGPLCVRICPTKFVGKIWVGHRWPIFGHLYFVSNFDCVVAIFYDVVLVSAHVYVQSWCKFRYNLYWLSV